MLMQKKYMMILMAVGAKPHEISTETLENGYTLYPSYTFRGRELMGR